MAFLRLDPRGRFFLLRSEFDQAAAFQRKRGMIRGFFMLLVFQLVWRSRGALARAARAPARWSGLRLLSSRLPPLPALAAVRCGGARGRATLARRRADCSPRCLLLFVPAGVGVVQYLGLLRDQGLALMAALVVSTVATLIATVGVFLSSSALSERRARHDPVPPLGLSADDAALLADGDAGGLLVADALARAAHRHPLVNPVAIAIALLGGLLKLTGADYQTYFNGAQFVHFLLGPATSRSACRSTPTLRSSSGISGPSRRRWSSAPSSRSFGGHGRQGARRPAHGARRARAEVDHGGGRDGGHREARGPAP